MLEQIRHTDETVLHFIHVTCGSDVLDQIIPLFRNPYFWSPVYLFLLVYMWQKFGRQGLLWCLFFFVTFVFCDFVSASFIKPMVQRLRPCHNEGLYFVIRELVHCGNGFSFPSSHATNHWGFAAFMIGTLAQRYPMVRWWAILWASVVCYAQLYVCVHYPSDIFAGALLGSLIGWAFSRYFTKRFGKL